MQWHSVLPRFRRGFAMAFIIGNWQPIVLVLWQWVSVNSSGSFAKWPSSGRVKAAFVFVLSIDHVSVHSFIPEVFERLLAVVWGIGELSVLSEACLSFTRVLSVRPSWCVGWWIKSGALKTVSRLSVFSLLIIGKEVIYDHIEVQNTVYPHQSWYINLQLSCSDCMSRPLFLWLFVGMIARVVYLVHVVHGAKTIVDILIVTMFCYSVWCAISPLPPTQISWQTSIMSWCRKIEHNMVTAS